MKKSMWIASIVFAAAASMVIGRMAVAEDPKDMPQMQLPPGWTMEDVQAITNAAAPGEMHAFLTQSVGTWDGKCSSYMAQGTPAIASTMTMTAASLMDGRFVQVASEGDMPGMGVFKGQGVVGFDNVSQKFVAVWFDNMGTGIMNGTGDLSADGKSLTINYQYNCPLTKKPAPIREVQTITGPSTKTLEMFANDPKTGKEFKMMTIEFTKKS